MRNTWRTLAVRLNGDWSLTRMQFNPGLTLSRVQNCPHWLLSLLPFGLGWVTIPQEHGEAFKAALAFNAPRRLVYVPAQDPHGSHPFEVNATAVLTKGCAYLPLLHPKQELFIARFYSDTREVSPGRHEVRDQDTGEWRPLETFYYTHRNS